MDLDQMPGSTRAGKENEAQLRQVAVEKRCRAIERLAVQMKDAVLEILDTGGLPGDVDEIERIAGQVYFEAGALKRVHRVRD